MCLSGASMTATAPGVLVRGGRFIFFDGGSLAGPFGVDASLPPWDSSNGIGLRGAH
jgi:hypothetical protein